MLCFFLETQAGSKRANSIKYRMFIKMNIGTIKGLIKASMKLS